MTTTALPPARIRGWDRTAIVALGAAGCALSYDALQQMATAIHIRGLLTYLFPLVIDGFIAYGVRALLVLRTAPFTARLYVWTLFGTATTASIWANALHAVRLNQQHPDDAGLRLGDVTVGILSTLAPLALAGAVHLYILIARHPTPDERHDPSSGHSTGAGPRPLVLAASRSTGSSGPREPDALGTGSRGQQRALPGTPTEAPAIPVTSPESTSGTSSRADRKGHRPENGEDRKPGNRPIGRPPGAELDDLLPIARNAIATSGRHSRTVVRDAIRNQGISLSSDRLTELMRRLRETDTTQPGDAPG